MLHLSKLSIERIIGFLETLESLISQLGVIILPYIPVLFKIINAAIRLSTMMRNEFSGKIKTLKTNSKEGQSIDHKDEILLKLLGKWKSLYQVSLKRVAQIYTKYHNFDLEQSVTETLIETLSPNIKNLYIDASSNVSLLLKVFIVWSKYSAYLGYFVQFSDIIPSVVKIYSQLKAKKEVIEVVNQLLFSICQFGNNTDMEIEDEQGEEREEITEEAKENASTITHSILKDNVNVTIASIKAYFELQLKAKKQKAWKPNLKIIKILVSLSPFVKESSLCNDLLGLLQPLVDAQHINKTYDKRHKKENVPSPMTEKAIEILNGVLKIFANFLKQSTQQERFYGTVVELISTLYEQAPRESVVEMISSLQVEKFNLKPKTLEIIEAMNKYNKMAGRTLHYGAIAPICNQVNENYLQQCSFEDQQLILHQYFFFLSQEELSLRLAAQAGFKQFFDIIKEKQINQGNEAISKEINFVTKTILPKLTKGLKGIQEFQVKANLDVIDTYVCYFHEFSKNGLDLNQYEKPYYLDLKLLQNKTDLPQDFFDNIFDVQNHKRVKAVAILTKRLTIMGEQEAKQEEFLTVNSLKDVILPVLKFQIMSKHLQEDVLKASGSQITHAKTLVNNMIEAFSMALKHFSWPQYFAVLKANVIVLNRKAKYEKVMVRLLCSNLNYLDGGLPNIVEEATKEMDSQGNDIEAESLMSKLVNYEENRAKELDDEVENKSNRQQEKKLAKEIDIEKNKEEISSAMEIEKETENKSLNLDDLVKKDQEKKVQDARILQITQQLRKKILMPLRKHMHDLAAQENKENKIRVYTAVAITKVTIKIVQ